MCARQNYLRERACVSVIDFFYLFQITNNDCPECLRSGVYSVEIYGRCPAVHLPIVIISAFLYYKCIVTLKASKQMTRSSLFSHIKNKNKILARLCNTPQPIIRSYQQFRKTIDMRTLMMVLMKRNEYTFRFFFRAKADRHKCCKSWSGAKVNA